MRAIRCAFFLCCGVFTATAWAGERIVSPDGRFEAYIKVNHADGTGMKLFVHPRGSSEEGTLIAANDRWLDAKWSPDSHFLAVGNHFDGHINDIYVFGISRSDSSSRPEVALYAHSPSPGTYDVQWEVAGWNVSRKDVLLKKTVKFQPLSGQMRLHLGPHSLPPSAWPRD